MSDDYDPAMDELVPPWLADLGVSPMHFDRDGEPITLRMWCRLREAIDYIIVAKTLVQDGELEVSTVWLGIDHSPFGGGREIFETMVFETRTEDTEYGPVHPSVGDFQQRYATEAEALEGHAETVRRLTLEPRRLSPMSETATPPEQDQPEPEQPPEADPTAPEPEPDPSEPGEPKPGQED